jgi:SAM-dependent methyltransferase
MADAWYELASDEHFWIRHRNALLARILDGNSVRELIDVGCGHGAVLRFATRRGLVADGVELHMEPVRLIDRNDCRTVYILDVLKDREKLQKKYDAVLLLDVLEHIDDDVAFLQACATFLEPAGIVIVNVPAGSFLWSRYDETAGHVRRYSRNSLRRLAKDAGLQVVQLRPWGFFYVPLLLARKLMLRFVPSNDRIELGFSEGTGVKAVVCRLLSKCDLALRRQPFGTSLLMVVRRPGEQPPGP